MSSFYFWMFLLTFAFYGYLARLVPPERKMGYIRDLLADLLLSLIWPLSLPFVLYAYVGKRKKG